MVAYNGRETCLMSLANERCSWGLLIWDFKRRAYIHLSWNYSMVGSIPQLLLPSSSITICKISMDSNEGLSFLCLNRWWIQKLEFFHPCRAQCHIDYKSVTLHDKIFHSALEQGSSNFNVPATNLGILLHCRYIVIYPSFCLSIIPSYFWCISK